MLTNTFVCMCKGCSFKGFILSQPCFTSSPTSPHQTNCTDRQRQDYEEEICKTTGLQELNQANIEIRFGKWGNWGAGSSG